MTEPLRCFTAYDVRGRVPAELNETIAARIALACAEHCRMRRVVVGRDMRLSSPPLAGAIIAALLGRGVDVIDIGLCGTEEVYHAVFSGAAAGVDGGIMITASHNPADYNGMKIVRAEARPLSGDTGLAAVAGLAADEDWCRRTLAETAPTSGTCTRVRDKGAYIDLLLALVDPGRLRPLKLVVNSGNGCAGPVVDLLAARLPCEFIRLQHEPDGNFPNGVPNPLLPERRQVTADAVRHHQADLGIAWDGDFDRCFLYDETGRFIEGYYIVGLLAEALLRLHPGATILHDPRLVWNTKEIVRAAGGKPVMTRTGDAFIKERMRELDALYGGEMSAHHYFREFGYCDSGMLPWLLVCRLLSDTGRPLSALVGERLAAYPVSGEINSRVRDADAVLAAVERHYAHGVIDRTDGLSVEFPEFRFNLRCSNTEPVVRLNVETRGDEPLLRRRTAELLEMIRA